MASETVPIGASMVEYMRRDSLPSEALPPAGEHPSLHENSALLIGAAMKAKESTGKRRLLLRGPRRSGRTSLAMDMACTLAALPAPRCDGACGGVGNSCKCVAAAFLVNERTCQDASFPLQCQNVASESDFESRLDAIDRARRPQEWNKEALGRIQIERLYSLRDLAKYLLSMPSKPRHQQPWGALILDNVEDFVRSGESEVLRTKEQMNIVQIWALLADTADALQRTHSYISILATMESSAGIPSNIERIFTNWTPAVVSLVPSEKTFSNNMLEDTDAVEATYQAKLSVSSNGIHRSGCASFHFLVVRKSDDSFRLLWSGDIV